MGRRWTVLVVATALGVLALSASGSAGAKGRSGGLRTGARMSSVRWQHCAVPSPYNDYLIRLRARRVNCHRALRVVLGMDARQGCVPREPQGSTSACTFRHYSCGGRSVHPGGQAAADFKGHCVRRRRKIAFLIGP